MIHLYEGGEGRGAWFSALAVQASQLTLVVKCRLYLFPEWSALFSNIINCLWCLSSAVRAPRLDIKPTCFRSKASRFFHLLQKQRSKWLLAPPCSTLDLQHKSSAALRLLSLMDYSSQVNHQALRGRRRIRLRRAPPRERFTEAFGKGRGKMMPVWLFCILSVCKLLWQQKVPAEPRRQVRGLPTLDEHRSIGARLTGGRKTRLIFASTVVAGGGFNPRLLWWGVSPMFWFANGSVWNWDTDFWFVGSRIELRVWSGEPQTW